jgi:hypothetical protein
MGKKFYHRDAVPRTFKSLVRHRRDVNPLTVKKNKDFFQSFVAESGWIKCGDTPLDVPFGSRKQAIPEADYRHHARSAWIHGFPRPGPDLAAVDHNLVKRRV